MPELSRYAKDRIFVHTTQPYTLVEASLLAAHTLLQIAADHMVRAATLPLLQSFVCFDL